MKFRSTLLILSLVLMSTLATGQQSLNQYKYVLVQKQYEFQRSMDSYQVNSLLKFLFERAGFTAYFTDERVPEDLMDDPCLAVRAVLNNNPSFLRIKMNLELRDCSNAVVFSTTEATTKEKDYKKAYHEVIRETFEDIEALGYTYEVQTSDVSRDEPVKKEEVVVVKEPEKPKKPVVTEEKQVVVEKQEPVKAVLAEKQEVANEAKIVKEEATKKKEKKVKQVKDEVAPPPPPKKVIKQTLIGNFVNDKWGPCEIVEAKGSYQLKIGTEKAVFATIYPTSKPNVYILKWVAYIQPQLAELTEDGNLRVDADKGIEIFNKIN